LPVGAYSGTSVIGLVVGWLQLDKVQGPFQSFTVKAGEVTVLGRLEAAVEITPGAPLRRLVGARFDSGTLASIVDAAIARVGPASAWASALAAAKAKL
jgi:hypothetical protein